jgi:hypothetical protein
MDYKGVLCNFHVVSWSMRLLRVSFGGGKIALF